MGRRTQEQAFSLFSFQDIITSVTGILILVTLFLVLSIAQTKNVVEAKDESETIEALKKQIEAAKLKVATENAALTKMNDELKEIVTTAEIERRDRESKSKIELLQGRLAQLNPMLKSLQEAKKEIEAKVQANAERKSEIEKTSKQLTQIKVALEKLSENKLVFLNVVREAGKVPWIIEIHEKKVLVANYETLAEVKVFEGEIASLVKQVREWSTQRDKSTEYFVMVVHPDGIEQYSMLRRLFESEGFDVGVEILGEGSEVLATEGGATDAPPQK